MILDTLIRDFAVYVEAELGYSTQTAVSYRYDLRHFFDFLDRHDVDPSADVVTTATVREWIVEMHRRGAVECNRRPPNLRSAQLLEIPR